LATVRFDAIKVRLATLPVIGQEDGERDAD